MAYLLTDCFIHYKRKKYVIYTVYNYTLEKLDKTLNRLSKLTTSMRDRWTSCVLRVDAVGGIQSLMADYGQECRT